MCHRCFLPALWWQNLPFSTLWLAGPCSNFSFCYRMVFEEVFGFCSGAAGCMQREGGHHWELPVPTVWHGKQRAHKRLMQEKNHCWQSCSMCVAGLSFWFSCCVKTMHNTLSEMSVFHQLKDVFLYLFSLYGGASVSLLQLTFACGFLY